MKKSLFKGKKTVSVFIASTMLALTLTATMNMQVSAAVNTSQSYKVYNASNGSFVQSYTLSENPVMDRSKGVIGTDDRFVDFSKNGVVKIVTRGGIGTGFVVDDHTIATAAHVLYNGNAVPVSHIYFFKQDGSIDMDITNPSYCHIPSIYTSDVKDAVVHDYALITVEQDLSEYANFNLGAPLDNFISRGSTVLTTGFPGKVNDKTVNTVTDHNMYTSAGSTVDNVYDASIEISYNNDASGGNSGGPVYTSTLFNGKFYYTVVGIHAKSAVSGDLPNSANRAVRMTTDLIHFYKNNPNIDY